MQVPSQDPPGTASYRVVYDPMDWDSCRNINPIGQSEKFGSVVSSCIIHVHINCFVNAQEFCFVSFQFGATGPDMIINVPVRVVALSRPDRAMGEWQNETDAF